MIAIHTVGTAPTNVTFSAWTISQMSFGWMFGPAKICVAPVITPAKGTHQQFAWNIGTTWRITSVSEIAIVSAIACAMQCRKIPRCV